MSKGSSARKNWKGIFWVQKTSRAQTETCLDRPCKSNLTCVSFIGSHPPIVGYIHGPERKYHKYFSSANLSLLWIFPLQTLKWLKHLNSMNLFICRSCDSKNIWLLWAFSIANPSYFGYFLCKCCDDLNTWILWIFPFANLVIACSIGYACAQRSHFCGETNLQIEFLQIGHWSGYRQWADEKCANLVIIIWHPLTKD